MADTTYLPGTDVARKPGYFNPGNPFDTGYDGSENTEDLHRLQQTAEGRQYLLSVGWDPNAPQHAHDNPNLSVYPDGESYTGGGGVGDLTASPYYQQYQSQIQAAQAADLSSTKSALQQLLIAFGLVPEGFQDKYGALDDTIKQLIQKNTDTGVSQYARLMESKTDARNAAIANLAKRGLTRSGAKGYALRRGTLDFDRALSDALSGVLGQANQLQGGYASREMDRQANLASLLAQLSSAWRPAYSRGGGFVPQAPQVPQQPAPSFVDPSTDANPWNVWTGNTIGTGNVQLGGGSGTSSKKPLLYA